MRSVLYVLLFFFSLPCLFAQSFQELNNLYATQISEKQFSKALTTAHQALKLAASEFGTSSKAYSVALANLGFALYYLGKYNEAEQNLKTALSIYSATRDTLTSDFYYMLSNIGTLYFEDEQYNYALYYQKRALNILLKISPEAYEEQADDYHRYGLSCTGLGRFDEAKSAFMTAIYLMKSPKTTQDTVQLFDYKRSLALLYSSTKEYHLAKPLLEQINAFAQKNYSKSDTNRISALQDLSNLYTLMGLYAESDSLLLQEYNLSQKAFGGDSPKLLDVMERRAQVMLYRGQYDRLEEQYTRILAMQKQHFSAQSVQYAKSLGDWAQIHEIKGQYKASDSVYSQAAAIFALLGKTQTLEYAGLLVQYANLKKAMDDFEDAEDKYLMAMNIFKAKDQTDLPEYASLLNSLASLYSGLGRLGEALELYEQDLAITAENYGTAHPLYATSLANKALIHAKLRQTDKAIQLYTQSLTIRKATLGENHPDYANSLLGLANIYREMGKYSQAQSLLMQTIALRKKVYGETHPKYASALNSMASLLYQAGELHQAEMYLRQVMDIYSTAYGKEHLPYIVAIGNLANLYEKMERYNEAQPLFEQAISSALTLIDRNFAFFSDREKENFLATTQSLFEAYDLFCLAASGMHPLKTIPKNQQSPQITAQWLNFRLATKGILLSASEKMKQDMLNSGDDNLIRLYLQWQSLRTQYAKLVEMPSAEPAKQKLTLAELDRKANALEKELAKRSAAFARLNEKSSLDWKILQKRLKKNEAAIEQVRLEWRGDTVIYVALAFDAETPYPVVLASEEGKDLEGRYRSFYHNAMVNKMADQRSFGHYFGYIDQWLAKNQIKTVYFCPDGVYNQINLATLFNPATGKYLIEEREIRILTTLKEIPVQKDIPSDYNQKQLELFGAPEYLIKAGRSQAEIRKNTLRAVKNYLENQNATLDLSDVKELPGTEAEVKSIAEYAKAAGMKVKVHLHGAASEEAVKAVHHPLILHIATHGFFLQTIDTTEAALANSEDDPMPSLELDPMLRSGVVLSGVSNFFIQDKAVQDKEDGVLTAYELTSLDLAGTELVVFSACETGLGEIHVGEGVYGLQRAAKVAGAQSVLMSLWRVDDEASRKLMEAFYQNLFTDKMTKRAALLQAQLKLRQEYAHPYYWGAFVMIGE